MNNNYPLSTLSDCEVMISSPLSSSEQKVLLQLYMPIVGDKVISLYQTLYSLVPDTLFESEIEKHEKIIRLMHLRSIDKFVEIRNKLEAIGLVDVYYKDGLYIYYLKKPLEVENFFNNVELASLLEYQLGHDAYEKAYYEYMMRKLDIAKFEKITHTFDDVFDIELSENIYISQTSFNNINNGIVITNKDFDYNQFVILISAHDVINSEYYSDNEFINIIKRYSFLYKLTPEDMKNVVIMSCDEAKEVSFDEIRKNAKKVFETKNHKLGVVPKAKVKASSSVDNKLIKFLETASPSDFVKHKSGTSLTSTEIEMFDQILRDTNIGIGVLNVLIGYVLENLNGEIPSYNYFLKIINTWKRSGIKSTADAIDKVSGKLDKKTYKNQKVQKDVPNWYNEYVEELEKKQKNEKTNEENLDDLKDFFKPE